MMTTHRRRHRPLAIGVSMSVLLIAGPLGASSYTPTLRPITDRDRVDFAVGMSDAIVVGTLVSGEHPKVRAAATESVASVTVKQWTFHPSKWLKGKPKGTGNIVVGHNRFRDLPRSLQNAVTGDQFILFLEGVDHDAPVSRQARYIPATTWDYIVTGTPRSLDQGAHHITHADADTVLAIVLDAIAQQTSSAMAHNADVVVLGKADYDNQVECAPYGTPGSCIPVSVDTVFKGTLSTNAIHIYSVIPFYRASGAGALLFLRARTSGDYELLCGPASFVSFEKSGSDKLGRSLAQWRKIVGQARGSANGDGK